MIYVNSVSSALFTTIASDSTLVSSGISFCLNNIMNSDPNFSPWVGVYYDSTQIEPYRANTTVPWMATHNFVVYSQIYGYDNAEENKEELDKLNTLILNAVNANKKLDNTVLNLMELSINPFQVDLENEDVLFMDQINLQYQVLC